MNITEEKIDSLNSVLKIELAPEDYKEKCDVALRAQRKQMSLPGFRQGHVPLSLVKKQFGKAVLAEEINKVLNETLHKHITDNDLQILGNPIPKDNEEGDWDNPSTFNFEYELGIAPVIDVALAKKKCTYYTIDVDAKVIDKQVVDMAKRYGSLSTPDESGDMDLLMGTFVELGEKDEIKEGGIMNDGTISVEFVEDKKTKKKLMGLKTGDLVVVDPHKISKGHDDLAKMLGVTHDDVHHLDGNFQFKVNEVKRLTPSAIDQTLFDKVYGKDGVADLEAFRARVKEDLQKNFKRDQDWLFKREMSEELINKVNPSLPDEFLKKWISMSNEKPISPEQLEEDYPGYAKSLKWQLIEGKIANDNKISVDREELIAYAKTSIANQYAQYGLPMEDEQLDKFATDTLQNKEEGQRIYNMLLEEKVAEFCKTEMKIKDKVVSYDDFVKLVEK